MNPICHICMFCIVWFLAGPYFAVPYLLFFPALMGVAMVAANNWKHATWMARLRQ